MFNLKDHITKFIFINNLQISSHFIENTNVITYISTPKNFGLFYSFLIGLVIGKIWLYFNKSSIGKFFINKVNIYIFKYINIRILNISLFWKLFIFLFFLFIVIDIYQIYFAKAVITFDWNLVKLTLAKDNTKAIVDSNNSITNIPTHVSYVKLPLDIVSTVTPAFSSAVGMKAGLELAKSVTGANVSGVIGITILSHSINYTNNKIIISETKNSFIPVNKS